MKRRALTVIAFTLLAACARTSGTVEIPSDELPFPVARAPSSTGTPAPSHAITVFFVREGRLAPLLREVRGSLSLVEAVMRELLEGPTTAERAGGFATELPGSVSLLGITVTDGTALVDLSGEFQDPATPERIALRVAQVTWTLTEITGVGQVAFAIDGEAVLVTTDDGMTVDRPVRRPDYATFAPS